MALFRLGIIFFVVGTIWHENTECRALAHIEPLMIPLSGQTTVNVRSLLFTGLNRVNFGLNRLYAVTCVSSRALEYFIIALLLKYDG